MKVLLIGSGGREHAMACFLAASPECKKLYCAPGNAGISECAECVDISVMDKDALVAFAKDKAIDLVVVGPEDPLCAGLADAVAAAGISVFGPKENAAILEGSKAFMKDFFARHNIPTAAYGRFTDIEKAKAFITEQGAPIVIKTDGLAAGKGVLICQTVDEAHKAAEDMLSGAAFGKAGAEIVIEEFMDGEELSFFAIADGTSVLPFTSAQDHKRVGDGDVGLNTGGMGAYSPAHMFSDELQQKIMDRIIIPTVKGMKEEGNPFTGVLYAGLMLVDGEPKIIEYNVRFGDPECQVMLPRLKNDFCKLMYDAATGKLDQYNGTLDWKDDVALTVVMASNGYPESYDKGQVIGGLQQADAVNGVKVFHAGTKFNDAGAVVNNGGRVLNVTALAGDVASAQSLAYKAIESIEWDGGFCRRDIGWRAVKAAAEKAA